MAKPLRSQLNQIRAWVRQGRTDAWIAHQLEVSTSELREFRRRHELSAEEDSGEEDLRDEIEAEIEATMSEAPPRRRSRRGAPTRRTPTRTATARTSGEDSDDDERARPSAGAVGAAAGAASAPAPAMQASFDHGKEGYGLWLDPAIADDPVYAEHWADHRQVEVTVEPDRIVITRAKSGGSDSSDDSDSDRTTRTRT